MRRSRSWLAMSLFVALVGSVTRVGAQPPDHHTLAEIRDEGLRRSQVMDHIGWLSDVYGPRVTGTPAIEAAGAWARQVLEDWGLEVRTERFGFGHGWSLVRFHAHMVEPQVMPIIGFPRSWSSSTDGTVTAEAVRIDIDMHANRVGNLNPGQPAAQNILDRNVAIDLQQKPPAMSPP